MIPCTDHHLWCGRSEVVIIYPAHWIGRQHGGVLGNAPLTSAEKKTGGENLTNIIWLVVYLPL